MIQTIKYCRKDAQNKHKNHIFSLQDNVINYREKHKDHLHLFLY